MLQRDAAGTARTLCSLNTFQFIMKFLSPGMGGTCSALPSVCLKTIPAFLQRCECHCNRDLLCTILHTTQLPSHRLGHWRPPSRSGQTGLINLESGVILPIKFRIAMFEGHTLDSSSRRLCPAANAT
eukprot:766233-Hanusia_phi.AAC.2